MESSNKWYEKVPVQKEGENAMSEAMLALLGFATIIIVIALLLRNVTVPALAFVSVSTVTGAILVATGTFTIEEMGEFVTAGVAGVHGTASLFIFSVLFFGIMTDVGMFDKIINALMKKVGSNVVGVAMMTCIIAMIGHLDGGGASTFLITIPAMLPVYKRLNMRPTTLMLVCVSAMGVMNLLPWGGPTMRAATVLGIEPNALWKQIIPMQVVGIFIALGTAFIWGNIEKKRGAGTSSAEKIEYGGIEDEAVTDDEKNELARPKLFVFNVIVTLVVIVNLVLAKVPSYYIFMVGCAVALFVNYPGAKMQGKIIKSHAGPALTMASTILCAGVFLGVMQQTVPLTLMFDTDSFFFGMLPVLIGIGNEFGVNPAHIAIAMVVCRNCATFISPVVPATFLGTGLAGVEIKDHIKNSFFWIWGVSIICLISGIILGVIKF